MAAVDFLPVCDLLFNLISLTCYFCDVVFVSMVTYTLYDYTGGHGADDDAGQIAWFSVLFVAATTTLIACQILSFRWYLKEEEETSSPSSWLAAAVAASHVLLSGVIWRYGKLLFAPVDVAVVKREMRNLSILRLVHAFGLSAPSVLVQGYILASAGTAAVGASSAASEASASSTSPSSSSTAEDVERSLKIHVISSALSLFNICWGLASFNKNIRSRNLHRLILTWLGVISQLLWRLGTIGARCLALALYASAYKAWLLLFGFMHWICMITWIQVMQHQKETASVKTRLLVSWVYMIDFLNLDEDGGERTRFRVGLFYAVVFIENVLLVSLWSTNIRTKLNVEASDRATAHVASVLSFATGVVFMLIYYRLFHVTKTGQTQQQQQHMLTDSLSKTENGAASNGTGERSMGGRAGAAKVNETLQSTVFNCALNPALKKKKIPRVIPPLPNQVPVENGKMSRPFWKEPLPSQLQDHQVIPHDGGVYDGGDDQMQQKLTLQEMLQEKRRNESNYLQQLQMANSAALLAGTATAVSRNSYENYSSGDQGDIDSMDEQHDLAIRRLPPMPVHTVATSRLRNNASETRL